MINRIAIEWKIKNQVYILFKSLFYVSSQKLAPQSAS